MQVARRDAATILHCDRRGEALAARRGAAVQHAHPRPHPGGHRRKPRRRILHIDKPACKCVQPAQIPRAPDQITSVKPRMARPFHALLVQLAQQLRFRAAQRVPLQDRLRRFVVRAQKRLRLFAERLLKQRDQRRRMAVLCGEVGRLRQRILCAGQAPQHAVYQARCTRVGIFLCLRHRFIDRRRVRHFIQKHDLIRTEPQNVQHHRL